MQQKYQRGQWKRAREPESAVGLTNPDLVLQSGRDELCPPVQKIMSRDDELSSGAVWEETENRPENWFKKTIYFYERDVAGIVPVAMDTNKTDNLRVGHMTGDRQAQLSVVKVLNNQAILDSEGEETFR